MPPQKEDFVCHHRQPTVRQRVREILQRTPGWITTTAIGIRTGQRNGSTSAFLRELVAEGVAEVRKAAGADYEATLEFRWKREAAQ